MCFGGDSPQQPVNPAPYPYAEIKVKDAEPVTDTGPAPEPKATNTTPATKPETDTGANYSSIKM